MSYTRTWDETVPTVNITPANTIGVQMRNFKTDIRERVAGIFGMSGAEFQADPVAPKTLTLSGALTGATANFSGAVSATNFTGNHTGTIMTAAQANITSLGTLTGLAITAVNQVITITSSVGTGRVWQSMTNTGGSLQFGLESSTGGTFFTGGAIYASVFGTTNATSLQLGTNGIVRFTIDSAGNAAFTNNLNATLATAAQPNITSLGTLNTLTVNKDGNAILSNAITGTSHIYHQLLNTGGNVVLGLSSSTGGGIIGGSGNYSAILTSFGASNSLIFGTNGIARQTIDGAGNVVFTGTVTAANFVGPTTIDANNLTGTTLNAGVIHSSLKDLGTLTALTVSGGISKFDGTFGRFVIQHPISGDSNIHLLGAAGSGHYNWLIGKSVTAAGQLQFIPSTVVDGVTFSPVAMSVTSAGNVIATTFTGNLTGTILTAAQANITSVGTLTSLSVSTFIGTGSSIFITKDGSDTISVGFQLINLASSAGWTQQLSASNHLDFYSYTGSWGRVGRFTQDGKLLIGTTTTTGVAAGGIRAAGDSVFDGLITSNLTAAVIFTSTIAGTNPRIFRINNTSGATDFGTSGNVASTVFVNDTAYSAVFGTQTAKSLHLATNGVVRFTIDSAGAVSALGAWTFNSTISGVTTLTATSIFGTLATAAQGNITSVGTLSSLTMSGLITATSNTGIRLGTVDAGLFVGATNVIYLGDYVGATIGLRVNILTGLTSSTGGFSGALTGNVTGNVTGTILTAAQANITSLGTLTSLTVSGDLTLTAANSRLVPGATDFAIRNNGNSQNNYLFANGGKFTLIGDGGGGISIDLLNTGKYAINGTQVVGGRVTGWTAATATQSRTAITNADTLLQTINHLAALKEDLVSHGLIGV